MVSKLAGRLLLGVGPVPSFVTVRRGGHRRRGSRTASAYPIGAQRRFGRRCHRCRRNKGADPDPDIWLLGTWFVCFLINHFLFRFLQ